MADLTTMNDASSLPGVCVFPEPPANAARSVAYPHYVHEVLAHAGIAYRTIEFDELEARLPELRLLVTVGEARLSDSLTASLRHWIEAGGAWLSLTGLCGLGDLLGVAPCAPAYGGTWGGGAMCTVGEGFLAPTAPAHPLLDHLSIPLHFFNGVAVRGEVEADGTTLLVGVLDKHGRETDRLAVSERQVGSGRCLLIAPDALGAMIRIQQGTAVTRDGVPASDGTAPLSDGVLKCSDGAVLDWDFDRQDVPGVPGLKGFLEPVADQWRELIVRAVLHLAEHQAMKLPVLWLYPRNLPALAHMSHDSDGNSAELAQQLLQVLAQAQVHTTWCVIAPGYGQELITSICDSGHELAVHYDAMTEGSQWGEDAFESQWEYLSTLFGERPVTNKNHYTRWEGDTEFFNWCQGRGIQLEQSKGPSKTGEVGFTFGSCHPYFPVAPDGEVIDVLELPLLTQDLEVFVPASLLEPLLAATLKHHGVLHLLFHPAHIGKPAVARALLGAVSAATESGLEWWTAAAINEWERARRRVRWSILDATTGDGEIALQIESSLADATLLFLSQEPLVASINGQQYLTVSTTRWGHVFQAVTLDLHTGADYGIALRTQGA